MCLARDLNVVLDGEALFFGWGSYVFFSKSGLQSDDEFHPPVARGCLVLSSLPDTMISFNGSIIWLIYFNPVNYWALCGSNG